MVLNLISYPSKPIEVSNPNPMVYAHVTIKGVQLGLFLGFVSGLATNLLKMYSSKSEKSFNWNRLGRYSGNGILPAVIIANYMCRTKLQESVLQKNQSRAFRIQKSNTQNRSDDLTIAGLVSGALYGALYAKKLGSSLYITTSLGGLAGLLINFGIVAITQVTNL